MIQNIFSKFQNILIHEKTEYRLIASDIYQGLPHTVSFCSENYLVRYENTLWFKNNELLSNFRY